MFIFCSFSDPLHFGQDPDPTIEDRSNLSYSIKV
jgi:hypothetical protein